ncbi:hypothetical protein ABIE13_000725 [Ottowia thiooxydans]|uniref:DUF3899 domain-containing protein n=1 Tax=Ottowia thiooxydans TaxID=219182 RepID=A0ABV2Q493_9BURK
MYFFCFLIGLVFQFAILLILKTGQFADFFTGAYISMLFLLLAIYIDSIFSKKLNAQVKSVLGETMHADCDLNIIELIKMDQFVLAKRCKRNTQGDWFLFGCLASNLIVGLAGSV